MKEIFQMNEFNKMEHVQWCNVKFSPSILCLKIWKQVNFLRQYKNKSEVQKVCGTNGTKNPRMVRKIHGYETSTAQKVYGTKSVSLLQA